MTDIPTLQSERLVLRSFRAGDLDDYAPIRAEPAVAQFIGEPLTTVQTWERMAALNGQWSLRGHGVWAVADGTSGRVIGHAGLLHPVDWPGPEIAYSLGSAFWGRGLAFEAARTARDWAWATCGFPRLVSFIDPANARSIRVAEKLGAVRGERVVLRGVVADTWVHARPSAPSSSKGC